MKEETFLADLSQWQQLAVASVAVSRMYPNYALFCEITEFDGGQQYSNILALVWEYIAGVNKDVDFDKQQIKLDQITPNAEDHDMYGVWPALDAVAGLSALIGVCKHWHDEEIISIFKLNRSTIDAYLEVMGEDDQGGAHSLHQASTECFQQVADLLSAPQGEKKLLMKQVRALCKQETLSNIGLSL